MEEDRRLKAKQLAEFKRRQEKVKEMGGPENIEGQKKKGKLTARERIDVLLDKGTFREVEAEVWLLMVVYQPMR